MRIKINKLLPVITIITSLLLIIISGQAYAARTKLPRVVIDYKFDEARDFHEGLAAVYSKEDEAWGYVNNLGQMAIPFRLKIPEAGDFSDGFAFVGDRYIDTAGNPAFEDKLFENGREFVRGRAAVQSGGRWGYIDMTGKFAIAPIFEDAKSFSPVENLAPVKVNGLWGFINTEGVIKIPAQFTSANSFSEGLALVEHSSRFGYIDTQGRLIIKFKYHEAGDFKYDLAPVRLKSNYRSWGYINKQGKIRIAHRYNNALNFSNGNAPVATDGRWGFINSVGEKIISNLYDEARPFSEGLAAVRIDDKWGYIRQ